MLLAAVLLLGADADQVLAFEVAAEDFLAKRIFNVLLDRAAWFGMALARKKILRGQVGFLDELEALNP